MKLVTNNKLIIEESLSRIGYKDIDVLEIPFALDVPKGIPFYSAHYKVDVFNYFASLPEDEYSILLDSDVVCLQNFHSEFYNLVKEGVPSVYYLNSYGGDRKLNDVRFIVDDVKWLPWAGGEYIGGTADFYKKLYDEILLFKDAYWQAIHQGLFHVGDEMLTTIALSRLRKKYNLCPVDVKWFGIIHRYWSAFEIKNVWSFHTSLIHLPGDKIFEADIDLSAKTVKELFEGYYWFHKKQRLKTIIKNVVRMIRKSPI